MVEGTGCHGLIVPRFLGSPSSSSPSSSSKFSVANLAYLGDDEEEEIEDGGTGIPWLVSRDGKNTVVP